MLFNQVLNQVKLFSNAASEPVISNDDVVAVLEQARIVDAGGVRPGEPGYQDTYSWEYAVGLVYDLKAARAITGQTLSFTSEGSSVTRQAIDPVALQKLSAQWKAKAAGADGLTVIDLGGHDGGLPRSAYTGVTPDNPGWWRDVD